MEGSLQLHIDFQDAGQLHRNKLDWRERKRQVRQHRPWGLAGRCLITVHVHVSCVLCLGM